MPALAGSSGSSGCCSRASSSASGALRPCGSSGLDFRITREHGQWFERNGVRYLAMYHPSALLRDPARRPETYTDLLTLREAVRTLGPLPNA